MWETRTREIRNARWRRAAVLALGSAAVVVLGLAPGARAATVDHFTITNRTVTEGDSGTVNANFTIRYTGAKNDLSVDWATADGTATAGLDHVAASGTATFTSSGSKSVTISIQVLGDTLDEANETFSVNLSNAQPAALVDITDDQGIGTITDDDPSAALTIDDPSVIEGDAGTTDLVYTVSLTPVSGRTVTVNYATANGTATQPADYTATSGTLSFPPGTTTRTVTVPVVGDTLDENDETVRVNLSSPSAATIADSQGIATIVDDDPLPELSIDDASRTEGNSGTANLTFTLHLAPASGRAVTVDWATADGSATAPADYTAAAGTVTFTAGQTSRTITVPVRGDTLDELDETFAVELTNATNATVADGEAVGTIVDNDATPSLAIDDVTVDEGDAGTTAATFTVTLSAPSGLTVLVDVATADGTATDPADYAATDGTLTFDPGDTTRTVTVTVNGDVLDEPDETFDVIVSNASNATVDDTGVGTITDDDPLPGLTVEDASVAEGDAGLTVAQVPVALTAPSAKPITIDFATLDGSAVAGDDYTAVAGTIAFAPGETATTIDVPVLGDQTYETDEALTVTLSNPVDATPLADVATVTITNDDALPAVTVADVTLDEGGDADASASFDVSLSNPSAFPVILDVATVDGTAHAPIDYDGLTTTLTFAPGEMSLPLGVTIHGDQTYETDEAFTLSLEGPVGGTIATATATGTIVNDDDAPTIDVAGVSVDEGDAGDVAATFTLSLTGDTEVPARVDVATVEGTADAPADFATTAGTVTFAAGETEATVDVAVHGDTTFEGDETFDLELTGPTDATVATGSATGTIVNDDDVPALTVDDVSIEEPNAGTAPATFTVTLSAPSAFPVSVDYATVDGSAGPDDYTPTAGTLTVEPGELDGAVAVQVLGDHVVEPDETFTLELSDPDGATVADGSGLGTIVNDDDRLATTLKVRGRAVGHTVVARGHLVARRAGLRVDVTLLRKVHGRWGKVASRHARTVAPDSTVGPDQVNTRFTIRFGRRPAGRYLVRAAFRGDDGNGPSHARSRFRRR
jgi:Calx-beta domain